MGKNIRKKINKKILILEDDKEFRTVLIKYFLIEGIQAFGTKTIEEAIEVYKGNINNIELLLIDLWIPQSNGIEFLKIARSYEHPLSKIIPAVIMSCIITPDIIKTGRQLGTVKYFEKPIDLNELRKVVSLTLERKNHVKPIFP